MIPVVLLATGSVIGDEGLEGRFDRDLISVEQNSDRFNGSVLSGVHSLRSPGVARRVSIFSPETTTLS